MGKVNINSIPAAYHNLLYMKKDIQSNIHMSYVDSACLFPYPRKMLIPSSCRKRIFLALQILPLSSERLTDTLE